MVFVITAAVALLAVATLHLIVGWILASGLKKEVLVVGGRPPEPLGIWVRSNNRQTIVLTAQEARQDIGHPGATAIVFEGGHGQLGDVLAADRNEVTRSVINMWGEPPVCQDDLSTCPPVELNPYFYLSDPSELGIKYTEITYTSELGDIRAWKIEGANPRRWAVHVHGWTAHRQELLRLQHPFLNAGYNSLIIDYRNDPGAPLDPSGLYRFGLTEWKDLEAAVGLAIDGGAEELVLTGCSTGGALVMAFLENSALADKVTGVVLDSPNVILAETIRNAIHDVKATRLMIEFGLWIADLRWHINWEETNWVQRADLFLKVPALVFHGTSDHRVPISVSRQLEARVPSQVNLVEFPAAGHVMSWNADRERYEEQLAAFLLRI